MEWRWNGCNYVSLLVHSVVGQFDFLEGDFVFHPLGAGGRRVRVRVNPRRPLRFRFARPDPAGVEAEARVIRQHQIHQHEIFDVGVQSAEADFQRREHPPLRSLTNESTNKQTR